MISSQGYYKPQTMIHNLKGILYTSLKFEQYLFMYQNYQKLYIIYTTSSPRHLLMIAPSPSDCSVLSVTVRTILDVIFYLYIQQPSQKSQNAKKSHIVLENCCNWSRPVLFINQMCVLLMMSHFNNTTSTCTVYVHTDEQDIRNYNVQYSSPLPS